MSDYAFTRTRLSHGVWTGTLSFHGQGEGILPALSAIHQEQALEGLKVEPSPDAQGWLVSLPIPPELITDGVTTILLTDDTTGDRLFVITLLAGDAVAEDIRAEVDLLRAELDMLKRAFRRHCAETMT